MISLLEKNSTLMYIDREIGGRCGKWEYFGSPSTIPHIVGQITAIFERNRANDDTSIKFGTLVLQVILIKSARLAN